VDERDEHRQLNAYHTKLLEYNFMKEYVEGVHIVNMLNHPFEMNNTQILCTTTSHLFFIATPN